MKKILFLFIAAITIASCEDYNDQFYDELDEAREEQNKNDAKYIGKEIAPEAYTLQEADYEKAENENVVKYKNFSSSVPANEHLPAILNSMFYSKTEGFEMAVTYNYYTSSVTEESPNADYTLHENDYKIELGLKFANFGNFDDAQKITPILANHIYAYDTEKNSAIIDFAYTGVETRYGKWTFNGTEWSEDAEAKLGGSVGITIPKDLYTVSDDDYKSLGGNIEKYKNFSSSNKKNSLQTLLASKYADAVANTEVIVEYKYYDYSNKGRIAAKKSEEGVWGPNSAFSYSWDYEKAIWKQKTNSFTAPQTSRFAYKADVWKFVPPLRLEVTEKVATKTYVLTDEDYESVGNGQYKNFDVREGKDEESESVRIAKITTILKSHYELKLGDVYEVDYKVYNGIAEVWKIKLEVVEDN